MAKAARKRRGTSREALITNHLENVSRDLLETHPEIVRQYIGRNAGIYALYKKSRLYYVGLATGLRNRLATDPQSPCTRSREAAADVRSALWIRLR